MTLTVSEDGLTVVVGQLPAAFLPADRSDGVAGHGAGDEHGLAGHHLHGSHPPHKRSAANVQLGAVAHRTHLPTQQYRKIRELHLYNIIFEVYLGFRPAFVRSSVGRSGLANVEVTDDVAVVCAEVAHANAAFVVAHHITVNQPLNLWRRVSLGHTPEDG
jgi:hypothetical protein